MTIEEMRRKWDELKTRMSAMNEKSKAGAFTADDQTAWDTAVTELEELRVAIQAWETRQRQADELTTFDTHLSQSRGRVAGAQATDGQRSGNNASGDGRPETRSLGRRVIDSEAFKKYADARGALSSISIPIEGGFYHHSADHPELVRAGSRLMRETRGLVYTGTFPTGAVEPDRVPGILQQQFVRPTVRDAFGSTPTTSNLITFVRELLGSHTSGATWVAEPTATGGSTGLKTESTLVFDTDEAAVREVATWIPESENIRDDLPGLQSLIENRLLDFLAQAEDDALMNGDGVAPNLKGLLAYSGIQVADAAYFSSNAVNDTGESNEDFNRLQAAISLVQSPGLGSASFIFLHPTAYSYMVTASNEVRDYYGGGPFVVGAIPRIWGIPVIQTDKVEEDQAIVGDGRGAEVRDRMTGTIDIGWINDQFVRDMFTVRAKERLAFPVYRPGVFVEVELALNS